MQAGDLIGPYRLDALIAEGGMGAVWKAHHPTLDRWVAIKVIRTEVRGRADVHDAFVREVRNLSRLHSPQTLQVLDFGFSEGDAPYMVTEYLHGEDLRQRLRREGALSVDDALFIGTEVLKSLSEAHACGIIHRDLKPGNVFLQQVATVDGERFAVKVLDFGVAKFVGNGEDPEQTAWPGVSLKGSPRYMAPEQIRNSRVSAGTDLYAFGGLMYRLLSGEPPFGGGRQAVLDAHLTEPAVPLSIRCPLYEIPSELDAIIMRCLDKTVEGRPQSAEAVRRALEQIRKTAGIAPTAHERFADASVTMSDRDLGVGLGDLPGNTPGPEFRGLATPIVAEDPFPGEGPLPGAELLAGFDQDQMPGLPASSTDVDPTADTRGLDLGALEESIGSARVDALLAPQTAPKPAVRSKKNDAPEMALELALPEPKPKVARTVVLPREETPLELAIEPQERAAQRGRRPDAPQPDRRLDGYGSNADRGIGNAEEAPPVPRVKVDRTQGVIAIAIVGLILAIAWLARVAVVKGLGVRPEAQLEQMLAARGIALEDESRGRIELTPMPSAPFEGVPTARPEDKIILDAGAGEAVQVVSVVVEPGPARFVQVSPLKVICDDVSRCDLPINIEHRVEKPGYRSITLSGDDLYDRRGNRWFVRLHR